MCSSMCILKVYVKQYSEQSSSSTEAPSGGEGNIPVTAVTTATNHLEHIIKMKNNDYIDLPVDPRTFITPFKRKCILNYSYALSKKGCRFTEYNRESYDLATSTLSEFLALNITQNSIEGQSNTWIMKPGAKSRGRGVIPQNNLDEIIKLADSCKEEKWVIQKYIEHPFLVHNTKFDIRQWFMVTDWNPLTLYFYQDSYLRFGSRPFTLDDFDPSIHLCNNSIQKKFLSAQGQCESSFAQGNMWTSSAFKKHLDKQGNLSKWDDVIFPGMKKSIQGVMMTIQDIIEDRKNSFELYGADFMVDSEFTPWLIEINCSPAMGATTKVTERLCSEVLDDCIKVVIDKKECRSAPTGKWEVIYKQQNVSVPPYIGVQLACEGRFISRPSESDAKISKPETPVRPRKIMSLPYNNADYLYKIKFAKETALAAIKEKKTFTILGPYPYLRRSLLKRGWVEKFSEHSAHPILGTPQPLRPRVAKKKKKTNPRVPSDYSSDSESSDSELKHDPDFARIVSRLLKDIPPTFIWTIKRDDIDFKYLNRDQIVNHYCRASSFTTKIGLCQHLRSLHWYDNSDPNEFFPRCYQLYSEEDREQFIDDFEMCSSMCILKVYVKQYSELPSSTSKEAPSGGGEGAVPVTAVTTAANHLEHIIKMKNNDYIDLPVDPRTFISPFKRKCILNYSYALSKKGCRFTEYNRESYDLATSTLSEFLALNITQNSIEGQSNTWIMKPGAKSRGRGVIPQNNLDEIIKLADSCKEEKWVIQKYIEHPFLVHNTKFDIRQWFMVTDWNPLTLYFYQDSYLRFGSRPFTLDDFDPSIHLCNNSIQKKFLSAQGQCESSFAQGNMWTSSAFKKHLDKQGNLSKWDDVIFPGMKKSIQGVMMTIQDIIEDRKNSFELYGADFMVDSEFTPWLIEINCSPAMGATTKVTERLCSEVLDDCIKVVIDKKECRSAPTGKWEVIYKQQNVSVPPYIGVQLACEGRFISRPTPPKKKNHPDGEAHESSPKKIKSPRFVKPEQTIQVQRRPIVVKQELKSSKIGVPCLEETSSGGASQGIQSSSSSSTQQCCTKPTGMLCKQVSRQFKKELTNSMTLNPPTSISLEQISAPTQSASTSSLPTGGGITKEASNSTLPSITERTSPHLSTLSISPISSFPPSEDRWQIRKQARRVSEMLPHNINPYKLQQIISRQTKPKNLDMLALQRKYSCKEEKWVIQKYIEHPFLVHNTKFDIRQWFMVTDWNPLTLYFYQDSYLRFGSRPFTLDDFDPSIHLCNNSIQKKFLSAQGQCESSFAQGNMWTSSAFKKHLDKQGNLSKWDDVIFPGMKKSIQGVMMTIQDIIEDRKNSFELYGADFMVDSEFTPWLIELPCSPAMGATTKVTERLCSEVLDDCIKVVIDKKECRSAPTGKWEVIYKQQNVSVPPYIGVQLACEGRFISRPTPPKKKNHPDGEAHESSPKKIKSPRFVKPEQTIQVQRRPIVVKQELKSSKIGVPCLEETSSGGGASQGIQSSSSSSTQQCCTKPTGMLCKQVSRQFKKELTNSMTLNPPTSISLEQISAPTQSTSTSSLPTGGGITKEASNSTLPSITERTSPHLSTLSISPISSFPPSEDRWQIRKQARRVSEMLPHNINPYKLQQIISRQTKPKTLDMLALQRKYSHNVKSVKILDIKPKKRPKVGGVKRGPKVKSLSKLSNCPHCETTGTPGIILNLLKDPAKCSTSPRKKDNTGISGGKGGGGGQSQRPKKQFRVSLSQISTMSQKMLDIQQSGSTLKVVGEQQTS
eukprot:sb/3460679/